MNPAQIADGMNAALENAQRLAADSELLLRSGSFSLAASVAVLAIEEAGKVSVLRELALARTQSEMSDAWKSYRSHTRKNATWIMSDLFAQGARKLEDFRPIYDEASDHPNVLDNVKQLGFYTDCVGKAHWSKPSVAIGEQLAAALVAMAKFESKDAPRHTQREIELWIEHLAPVWKQEMAWMKQALVNWHAAMQAEGLAPEGPNIMEQFVR